MRDDNLIEAMARGIHSATQRDGSWWPDLDEDEQEMCRAEARAALAALQREWAVVPREPTMEMQNAAALRKGSDDRYIYADIYRAMIAAAPQPEEAP